MMSEVWIEEQIKRRLKSDGRCRSDALRWEAVKKRGYSPERRFECVCCSFGVVGWEKKFLEPCAESETRKTGLVLAWSLALRPGRRDFPADQKDNQDARADDKQGAFVLERIKRSCC
jgi:hypothetical protein